MQIAKIRKLYMLGFTGSFDWEVDWGTKQLFISACNHFPLPLMQGKLIVYCGTILFFVASTFASQSQALADLYISTNGPSAS